jgi:hypothetical protein
MEGLFLRENIIFLELFGIGPYIAVILVLYVEEMGGFSFITGKIAFQGDYDGEDTVFK